MGFSSSLLGNITIQCNIPNARFTLTPSLAGTPNGGPFPVNLTNVPIGTYQLTFSPVPGYITPTLAPFLVTANATASLSAVYTVSIGGTGTILVGANQAAASFNISSAANTYTGSGLFFSTGPNVPAGTYTITFNAIHGYYTPSPQILTLAPGGTIQFTATYRRLIVALFTGFGESPNSSGLNQSNPGDVEYDSGYSACTTIAELSSSPFPCYPGMVNLAWELQFNTFFNGSLIPQVFTFYNSSEEKNDSCPLLSSVGIGPEYCPPPDNSDHDIAQAWIDEVAKPGPDDLIIVIGHSYGGNRARLFVNQLANDGHPVAGLITIDPIDWQICSISPAPICDQSMTTESKPDSVSSLLSFTQDMTNVLDLAGYHLWTDPAEPPGVLLPYGNQILSYPGCETSIPFCAHRFIAWDQNVHAQIETFVQQLLAAPPQAISNLQAANVTTNSVQISWNTFQNADGQVLFATDSTLTAFYVAGTDSCCIKQSHAANISGLLPGQPYYYRVSSTPIGETIPLYSSVKTFVTLANGSPLVNATIASFNDVTEPVDPVVTLQLKNTGTATATACRITKAMVGTVVTSMVLPISLPDLVPGGTLLPEIVFPGPIGPAGSLTSVLVSGDCSGRAFAAALRPRL